MTRPTPRRPASSRGGTQRPRKIAGQATPVRADEPGETEDGPAAASDDQVDGSRSAAPKAVLLKKRPPDRDRDGDRDDDGRPARPGVLARQKTTRVLIAVLVLVAFALAAETLLFVVDRVGEDDPPRAAESQGAPSVPEGRPVVADELSVQEGVETAAKAAQEIVAVDHQKYDQEVDDAADLMTTQFEEQYRKTAGEIEKDFVANKTAVQATVVGQGVVTANRTRLQALVFLNQVVSRVRDGKPETVVTPFKVLVTMVHTDRGWFVDGLDTDAPADTADGQQDKTN